MKFKAFFRLTISLAVSFMLPEAFACGPFSPIIPTPDFFRITDPKKMSDYDKEENLRLWQKLTSEKIPLSDIEQVVYKDSRDEYDSHTWYKPKPTSNLFYTYINNTDDREITDFLSIAKRIEEKRSKRLSPWYYPQDRNYRSDINDFEYEIEQCKRYQEGRLRDRYALQVVRALFASRQYESCIEYYDLAFTALPEDNLMKRMALRYVAGCWSRLGDTTERVDSIFAQAGDIWSIGRNNRVEYMMERNPNAPQIMEYIRSTYNNDAEYLAIMVPIAQKTLKNPVVKNKGDWAYLLAYYLNEHCQVLK